MTDTQRVLLSVSATADTIEWWEIDLPAGEAVEVDVVMDVVGGPRDVPHRFLCEEVIGGETDRDFHELTVLGADEHAAVLLDGDRVPSLIKGERLGVVDGSALDVIAYMLRDPEWGVGMLEDIREIIDATGRNTETMTDDDGNEVATWLRH